MGDFHEFVHHPRKRALCQEYIEVEPGENIAASSDKKALLTLSIVKKWIAKKEFNFLFLDMLGIFNVFSRLSEIDEDEIGDGFFGGSKEYVFWLYITVYKSSLMK